ncbi:uncharacterized protein EI97DRAFT_73379 [Westerdykella ornata]|uniref:Uncharacterized protein n=1 Tax=Westerdykella ornata TaxID=318751 RepID=A0A6A6JGA9_WESOR|nr:uncharacterized protein EI97DRAFT_73379 [Westerdykella ornata]KAF2275377.1 hypothetical protein EI97DRAFT_73379 [Westerdykella ornata]
MSVYMNKLVGGVRVPQSRSTNYPNPSKQRLQPSPPPRRATKTYRQTRLESYTPPPSSPRLPDTRPPPFPQETSTSPSLLAPLPPPL